MRRQSNSRLAARTRWMYLSISMVTLIIIMIIAAFIANGIASDASQRIARQYSIEAAGNFQAHINPHLTLMLQLARSTTIARWLADDTNTELKNRAFEEVIGYASYMPTSRFMLTAYDTLNIYDFLPSSANWLTQEDFVSLGVLVPGQEAQWFFNTRDDELFFNLNIQREMAVQGLDPGTLQMWANQRVYYQGRFVGVVAIGFPFRYIFDPTFGSFAVGEMRGYIIDRYGGVRVDSAELLDVFDDGLPTFPVVPETLGNPNLSKHIARHLAQRIDGIYQLGAYTFEAIRLGTGEYSHASIAPITGTDWSVVVLSYQSGIFDFQYTPLIFVVVAVMILSLSAGSVMFRRIVIVPLLNLTQSAASVDITNETKLYGMDRPDEIGDLARTIHQAQEELKNLHIVEEKNKAKSEFLARMSHEIRTPISAVLGIAEIGLQTPNIPQSVEDSFSKIYSSGKLLLGIINDILDFSKIEGGKMTIVQERYEVAGLITNAANLHYAYLDDKDIKFHLNVDEKLPTALIGDAFRIEQIIINILSNAFKYTDSGSVTLSLQCRPHPANAGYITLEISITDTGLGMSKEQIAVLFDDYTRFHEQEKSNVSGTGLGMSIVANLVRMLDAAINVESEVGNGTTVTIKIPQEKAAPGVLGSEMAAKLQQFELYSDKAKKRQKFIPDYMPYGKVLVVDDIQANLYVAQGLLAFYSLTVETCSCAREAIDKINQGDIYDIVFMDHMMPGINGPQAMKMLREMGYTHPIVVLTANALVGQEEEYIKSGFDGFLSKPIMTGKLDALLVKFVKGKQPPEVIEAAEKENAARRKSGATPQSIGDFRDDVYVLGKLRADFHKSHKNTFRDITQALGSGDTETAHIMAHTLKGLAGMINENSLSHAAARLEHILAGGKTPSSEQLAVLERELSGVFESIGKSEAAVFPGHINFDKNKAKALFDKLYPLLQSHNSDSMNFLDELRVMPEMAVLVHLIDDFEFEQAVKTIDTLRKILDV